MVHIILARGPRIRQTLLPRTTQRRGRSRTRRRPLTGLGTPSILALTGPAWRAGAKRFKNTGGDTVTIIGLILVLVGGVAAGLEFSGNAPAFLANLPVPPILWVVVALVGAAIMYFNRRPGD